MHDAQRLREARNSLLKLHKTLVDREKMLYQSIHGPISPGQYLNLLIEDPDFTWLRKFSTLIVDIDEMFAQRDGFAPEAVDLHIAKLRELVKMEDESEEFKNKYQAALQQDLDAAAHQGVLKDLLFGDEKGPGA